jgi:predicted nucleotidyltransferase
MYIWYNFPHYQKETIMKANKIEILKDFNQLLKLRFTDDLKDLVLFGSQISGKANKDSDYDFLVILKHKSDWKTEREISDLSYEIELKYNIVTDTHVLAESELTTLRGKQPIFVNAITKGLHA